MGSFQPISENGIPTAVPTMDQPPQIFGGDDLDTSPTAINFLFDQYGDEFHGDYEERDDAKRRRIAKVKRRGLEF